ncbi:hypothetical protein DPMN_132456 [Dreissena polymorpha]|uniref:Uncharacterized protein n=1 Tax=Dreissena polymorpha TaxID=45954 RepID=A0A9D4FRL4_DREPO|nr:hypothetical protein DPMN_132456 [Dreissena polymorpha]
MVREILEDSDGSNHNDDRDSIVRPSIPANESHALNTNIAGVHIFVDCDSDMACCIFFNDGMLMKETL